VAGDEIDAADATTKSVRRRASTDADDGDNEVDSCE
jgi:hypothetical protein